jgi:hypothetical protein
LAWLLDTQDQLNQLIMSLETSIACWDNFTPQDHFHTLPIPQSLRAIQQIFIEMRNCLIILKSIRTLYDSHEKAVWRSTNPQDQLLIMMNFSTVKPS